MQRVALALLVVLGTSVTPAAEPEQPTVRVEGVVLKWIRADKEANLRRIEPMIREAAGGGAMTRSRCAPGSPSRSCSAARMRLNISLAVT